MTKAAFTLLFVASALISASQVDNEVSHKLTQELQALADEELLVGFSVAIFDAEGTLYQKGFGYADTEKQIKYTAHTIQNIASISKTFSGIALLKAQELGLLDLDDPINKHLSFEVINPYHPEEEITIRQVASHTSSIQDRGWWYGFNCYVLEEKKKRGEKKKIYFSNPDKMLSLGEFYQSYLKKGGKNYKKKSFTKHKPGDYYEYSNIASALGAYIIELTSGQNFKDFTQRYIFDPLDMSSTGWSFDDVDIDPVSYTHLTLPTKA